MTPDEADALIPTCGCGDPVAVTEIVHWTLAMFAYKNDFDGAYDDSPQDRFKREVLGMDSPFDPLFWAFLATLDNSGLLEHGVSIRQSWLTDKGKDLLTFLDTNGHDSQVWLGLN